LATEHIYRSAFFLYMRDSDIDRKASKLLQRLSVNTTHNCWIDLLICAQSL